MLLNIKDKVHKSLNTGKSYLKSLKKQLDKQPILQLIIYSIVLIFILEMLSRRSIIKGLSFILANPLMFLFNVLIILFTLSVTMLFSRKRFLLVLITILWLGLGVTNFVLLSFRTTPLAAMDFILMKSVIGIIHIYLNTIQIILVLVIVAILIVAMLFLWKKFRKNKALFRVPIIALSATAILMLSISTISLRVNALSTNYGNLADAYLDYGFAYCFSISIFDRGIDEPDDYSVEIIDAVLEKIECQASEINTIDKDLNDLELFESGILNPPKPNNEEDETSVDTRPNIIMVQLESFFDVNNLIDYTFSENPTPNFTQLKKDYSSGYLTVPSIGAGTANTEFEIITGMNIEHFGAGEYPYKTILQTTTCESICYNLDELGYQSHAIHNNTGTFYDRNLVFQKLGFDSFSSIEYMNSIEYNPMGWAKDKVLKTEIFKALVANENRDFIYTISVQPHGKYPETIIDEKQTIKVSMDLKKRELFDVKIEKNNKIENILEKENLEEFVPDQDSSNQINAEEYHIDHNNIDENYKNKFEYFANQLYETDKFIGELIEELSVYNEPTVVVFYGDHLPSMSFEDGDFINNNRFQTEYVLWSNFEMEQVNRDIKAYQLNAYVMERLGYENGVLTKFHLRYVDESDYQEELKLLQYDMLYGSKNVYQGVNPFIEKKLKMGVNEIMITSIKEKGEVMYVEGDNFTPWSVVYIDEEAKETLFVDENTLIVPYEKYTDKGIYIAQVSNGKIILSQSKEWKAINSRR